jgi:hypothetical protein
MALLEKEVMHLNRSRKPIVIICCVLLICAIFVPIVSADSTDSGIFQQVKALSYNIYVGADIFAVIDPPPTDLLDLLLRVRNGFDMTLETNFPARADAIANQIARLKPDIIGLQEVSFVLAIVDDQLVVLDYLSLLTAALQARGLEYVKAASK